MLARASRPPAASTAAKAFSTSTDDESGTGRGLLTTMFALGEPPTPATTVVPGGALVVLRNATRRSAGRSAPLKLAPGARRRSAPQPRRDAGAGAQRPKTPR